MCSKPDTIIVATYVYEGEFVVGYTYTEDGIKPYTQLGLVAMPTPEAFFTQHPCEGEDEDACPVCAKQKKAYFEALNRAEEEIERNKTTLDPSPALQLEDLEKDRHVTGITPEEAERHRADGYKVVDGEELQTWMARKFETEGSLATV